MSEGRGERPDVRSVHVSVPPAAVDDPLENNPQTNPNNNLQANKPTFKLAPARNDAVYTTAHAAGILLALIGMALQWATLHSITFLSSVLGEVAEVEAGSSWIINSIGTLTVFCVIFFVSRRTKPLVEYRSVYIGIACVLACSLALILIGNLVFGSTACNYLGNLLITLGTAPGIIMWGEVYKYLNPKNEQLLVTIPAAALAVVLYLVEISAPTPVTLIMFIAMPFIALWCLARSHTLLKDSSDTWRAQSPEATHRSPALFLVCIVVFSIPYNYLRTTDSLQMLLVNIPDWMGVLAVTFVVLAAIGIAEWATERHGIVLVPTSVLILLSASMLVFLLASSNTFVMASLLYSGYYLFLSMVYLALGPIATVTGNPTRLFSGAMIANVAGLLVGSAMGEMGGWLGDEITTIVVLCITYALLIVGFLLLSGRSYSLFRVNNFDEQEYSFEYVTSPVPWLSNASTETEHVSGSSEEPISGEESASSMLDAVTVQCQTASKLYHLSARENEVLIELIRGHSIASIAEDLVVSENTVKAHTKAIYRKLDVHTREELFLRVEEVSPEDKS